MTRPTTTVVVLYLVIGAAWIVVSDQLLSADGETAAQTVKGLAYVAVTGLLLYALLRWWERRATGAEQALTHATSLFKTVFERLDDALIIVDGDRKIVDCSESVKSVFGYSPADLLGRSTECLHVDRAAYEEFGRRSSPVLDEHGVFRTEFTLRHRDGHEISTEHTVAVIRGGELFLSIVRDVTAERQAEREIARRRAHLEALLANVTDIVAIVGVEGAIDYLSPAVERILGYPRDELVGHDYAELVHPEDLPRVTDTLRRIAAEPGLVLRMTYRLRAKGDHWVMAESIGARPIGGAIDGVVVSTRDISAERELSAREQQLVEAQKMEAIGRLAGGIAHDFNNILNVILAYASFLDEGIDGDDPRAADLSAIKEATGQAIALTRQLLLFSRQQRSSPDRVELDVVVGKLENMLRRSLGEDVTLVFESGEDLPRVYIDEAQLVQVLMNLAINARDAMPTGGTLRVATSSVEISERRAADHSAEAGRYACIEVTDTGVGMDAKTIKQIFEPFFTTKAAKRGTGLGLATSYGIVKRAGGWIELDSEIGVGSSFRVHLPEASSAPQNTVEEFPSVAPLHRGSGETILLVEDDPAVRGAVHRQLESAGYHVVALGEPTDAIAAAQRENVDLLVTDVVMHGLNGPALAQQLIEAGRCTKVLYISGYTPEELGGRQIPDLSQHLLPKPFTGVELIERVQQALRGSELRTS